MTTSGTYAFNPALGDFVLDAFGNCGVRRTELTAQHMADARFAANLIMSDWAAKSVNLWAIDQQSLSMVAGVSTYMVPTNTVFILDAYLTFGSPTTDTLIFPISRSDYAAISDKQTQGTPSVFWFDRTLAPSLTVWNVPNQSNYWTLNFWRARQIQDATMGGGASPEIPYRFLNAFSWDLSRRLAVKYAPDKAVMLNGEYKEAWNVAASSDTENVPISIQPALGAYYR